MRLVIHAGQHKTSTTSFQEFWRQKREMLLRKGISFAEFRDWNQHSYAAWLLQQRQYKVLQQFLDAAVAGNSGAETVLISGEDFENCLVDLHAASTFEKMASAAGFTEISWYFVYRNPYDYLLSIYAEMAKHGAVLNLDDIAATVLKYGYFSVSTRNYNYHFVFDVMARVLEFRRSVSETAFTMDFIQFLKGAPGISLLEHIVGSPIALRSEEYETTAGILNTRPKDLEVERRYAENAFAGDIGMAGEKHVEDLVKARLASRSRALPAIREAFEECFGRI